MKLLVISDLHLDTRFDQKQFNKIKALIESADQVVLNGDFWDYYVITFDEFAQTPWIRLFPLLKSKQTIYLYGNHDPRKANDERVNLFSVKQAEHFKMDVDGLRLHFHHGQDIALKSKGLHNKTVAFASRNIEGFLRTTAEPLINRILQGLNEKMKVWAKENLADNEVLICGHTHIQEDALSDQFINTGYNCYGKLQYLMIDNGQPILYRDKLNSETNLYKLPNA